ncbi:hypothetical protein EV191_10544 [Tamaricihabitans halophyticus]|uniref:PhoX family phosphatase n=1 Tax=Tamaricihabitans halophyticus TaxID=1262583 RepID=A0A4R2QSV3_9PSEU|nr:PhoX family phosphatase [Tamaricihabitans halophyticus]TCP52983.1 hypothetical protein EV191_10544 [Tamaricihabitans halophyticus]
MTSDPDDISSNPSANRPFNDIAAAVLSRRSVLRGGTAAAAAGFLGLATGTAGAATGPATSTAARPGRSLLGFSPIPTSEADAVSVAEGYSARVLIPWGDPVRPDGPAWRKDASNSAAEQAEQLGSHHDGMHFFPTGRNARGEDTGLLVLNHEYIDQALLHTDGDAEMTQEKVDKGVAAHGVSVVAVALVDGQWQQVDSPLARRVTGATPVTYTGPVTLEHPALDSNNPPLGTMNNCSHGFTPWDTYLACEENWNSYFGTEDESWQPSPQEARYGIDNEGFGYRWYEVDPRWDIAVNSNEPHRFGWVVEIDPFDPAAVPVKRTALGRIKHEGALVTESRARLVVYTGDDQDGEYIYKYVSDAPWQSQRARGVSPLDEGTLYVARFDDDNTGSWLPLVFGTGPLTASNGWQDQADVLLRTREAADAVGATPMDRPEWISQHPKTKDTYAALTNGSGWGAANPRKPNPYGHIIRWWEPNKNNTGTTFEWDIFVLAGDPAYDDSVELSEDSMFGSPDGLWFDPDGRLWIQTDISNSAQLDPEQGYDNIGNNALLAADPESGDIRRFLVGPRGCELTGAVTTPDQRTLFVNVQHPGEETDTIGEPTPENPRAVSNWPEFDPQGRPRSATLAIRKDDGGIIGT